MSEKIPTSNEHLPKDKDTEAEQEQRNKEHRPKQEVNHKNVAEKQDSIDEILKKIEKEATSTESVLAEVIEEEKDTNEDELIPINKSLKSHALNQNLRKIQRKLPAAERGFSKVIHKPIIEQVSDVASETIARPSGLLIGGLFSTIASIAVLMVCRYYGYEYNFMIGLVAFVAGFVCGISIEALSRAITKSKHR